MRLIIAIMWIITGVSCMPQIQTSQCPAGELSVPVGDCISNVAVDATDIRSVFGSTNVCCPEAFVLSVSDSSTQSANLKDNRCAEGERLAPLNSCQVEPRGVTRSSKPDEELFCCPIESITPDTASSATEDGDCPNGQLYVPLEDCIEGIGEKVDVDLRSIFASALGCCPKGRVIHHNVTSPLQKGTGCPENDGYSCVKTAQCLNNDILTEDNGKVLKVVTSTTSIRQLEISPQRNLCKGDLEVCCKIQDAIDGPVTNEVPSGIAYPTDEDYVSSCGKRSSEGIDIRIVGSLEGDNTAQVGEWPFMCILYHSPSGKDNFSPRQGNPDDYGEFIGGASLITPGLLLTVAHKVDDKNDQDLLVRCGVWNIKQEDPTYPSQIRRVRKILMHPSFYKIKAINDYAILQVEEEFNLSPRVDVICLPEQEYEKTNCFATGFGKDTIDGQYQRAMKQVQLPIVEFQDCQNRLRTEKGQNFNLHENFVCAGGDVGDTCQGDGGGPLMCPVRGSGEQKYVQVGITAWGVKCNTPNIPGVYASVEKGLCFIKWGTRCMVGTKYENFYGLGGCQDWISEELQRLNNEKSELLSKPSSAAIQFAIKRIDGFIKNAENLSYSCAR